MPRNVMLAAALPASSEQLFDMYLDANVHAALTGAAVVIEPRPGACFTAFDGMLTGTMLHIEPKRLIVQTWRSANWSADAIDSILTLSFCHEAAAAGRIELVHVNIPDEDFAGVSQGWSKYYWEPWRAFLSS